MPCYLGMVLNNPISDRIFVWIMVYQNALGKVISLLVCWFEQYLTHKMNQIQINIVIKAISKNNCIYGCVRHVVSKFLIHKKSVKIISISPVRSEKVICFPTQEVRKSQKINKMKAYQPCISLGPPKLAVLVYGARETEFRCQRTMTFDLGNWNH